MSGLLEAIHADLQYIKGQLERLGGAPVQQQAGFGYQPPVQQPATTGYVQPAAQPAPVAAPPANLTADQITALIQPHIANEQIKAELGTAMRAMGINALPETQPHQYGELYQRFQAVIQRFTGGGAPVQQAAAPPASII